MMIPNLNDEKNKRTTEEPFFVSCFLESKLVKAFFWDTTRKLDVVRGCWEPKIHPKPYFGSFFSQ